MEETDIQVLSLLFALDVGFRFFFFFFFPLLKVPTLAEQWGLFAIH